MTRQIEILGVPVLIEEIGDEQVWSFWIKEDHFTKRCKFTKFNKSHVEKALANSARSTIIKYQDPIISAQLSKTP